MTILPPAEIAMGSGLPPSITLNARIVIPADVLGEMPPNCPKGPAMIASHVLCIAALAAVLVCDAPASLAADCVAKYKVAYPVSSENMEIIKNKKIVITKSASGLSARALPLIARLLLRDMLKIDMDK